jgi:hypothetical protein
MQIASFRGRTNMEGFGIALQSVGAILIAYSQFQMNRTISIWLQSLDVTVDQIVSGALDIVRVRGIDQHWDRDLRRDRWLSPIGWICLVVGEILLLSNILNAH